MLINKYFKERDRAVSSWSTAIGEGAIAYKRSVLEKDLQRHVPVPYIMIHTLRYLKTGFTSMSSAILVEPFASENYDFQMSRGGRILLWDKRHPI